MDAMQRRALRNGVVAFAVTAMVGFGVNALFAGGEGGTSRVASTEGPSPSPACTAAWEQVDTPSPDKDGSQLLGVVAASGTDVWGVGSKGDPEQPAATLVEHWDGTSWEVVDSPNAGTVANGLLAVDASGPEDVWAVGSASNGAGSQPLILHWDGASWETAIAPNLLGGGRLSGVVALAPTDAWAVGSRGGAGTGPETAIVLHWDGSSWTVADAKVGGGQSLLGAVDASAPDDIWAVGERHRRPAAMQYDGKRWRWAKIRGRGPVLGVSASAPDQVWVVGSRPMRWNGSAWKRGDEVPEEGILAAVSGPSTAGLWAVGSRPAGKDQRALVELFDGKRWILVEGPSVPGSEGLVAVSALPDGAAWGVGYRESKRGRRTLAVRISQVCG